MMKQKIDENEFTDAEVKELENMIGEKENPNMWAQRVIVYLSEYMTKDEHIEMAGYFINAAKDFPNL